MPSGEASPLRKRAEKSSAVGVAAHLGALNEKDVGACYGNDAGGKADGQAGFGGQEGMFQAICGHWIGWLHSEDAVRHSRMAGSHVPKILAFLLGP